MRRCASVPYSVRLDLTNRCNLRCVHCLANATPMGAREKELTFSEWICLFNRLRELQVFNISLSGGEVLLRPDFFQLLENLRFGRRQSITVLTNGTLINKVTAREFARLQISKVSVSLDGMRESHDQIRGSGAFEATVAGIHNLLEVNIRPNISFTPMRTNYLDIGQVIEFAAGLGIASVRVNTLNPEGRCTRVFRELALRYPDEVSYVLNVIEELRKTHSNLPIYCELGFYLSVPAYYAIQRDQCSESLTGRKSLMEGCSACSTSCEVTATGEVIPCTGLAAFPGGNIRDRDFLDIWREASNFRIIRELAELSTRDIAYCRDCPYSPLCNGGCRAAAYIVYHDLHAPDPWCPHWEKREVVS